ncbi:uncharacterized protein L969DRAFT_85807 [Mixia osmundae IAM 14324]|uniref:Alcohol dehydrogenase-like N-terminal domain-containing protein n=1 Tax=Mixia osmundae (strain CBS 9802 / IAM 14324 / JCM 22182 / KY 12970) TaxID=764103 RepID=G7E5Y5_MIXOS|nr:uncharacterized protein L969DRAFT_85807 [Mixia osmundae IAM 14324]KEI40604.1 hypothetical protein L969DRAFT_85807 [Mixia osmundae IAM 14324]GAA98245.1 hypothetical protein E5Q_04928 [Mixia osmundae IAM 14324]
MAMNAASNKAEQALGHGENTKIHDEISNPGKQESKYADPSGEKMKALAWMGKNHVELVETHKPRIVDDKDVIVKVTGTTICGSDRHLFHGAILQLQKGDILGHEYCGIIEKTGPAVKNFKVGDRVVASFQIACGDCEFCDQKLSSVCQHTNGSTVENTLYGNRTAGMLGYSHFTGGFSGGQSEYVRQPIADFNLLKIPDEVPDEKALYLSDVLCTSYHCVVDTGIKEGDVVAVWGLGAVGLLACQWAFLKGAGRVIGVDSGWRLDFAKEKVPKLELLDFKSIDMKEGVSGRLHKMTKNGYGVDVSLECASGEFAKGFIHKAMIATGLETDTSEILNEMILATKPFGRIGITGIYAGFTNNFNIGAIMETGIRFIGNGQAPVKMHWETIMNDYIIPGKLDPMMVMTHRIKLEDIAKLYPLFDQQAQIDGRGIEKPYIETRFSQPACKGSPALSVL